MTTKQIGRNKICVTLTANELREQCLDYDEMTCADRGCRKFLYSVYLRAAALCGIKPNLSHLTVELYPFIENGCMIVYTTLFSVARNRSFFCRFDCENDLLDCLSKLGAIKSIIDKFTLYKMGDYYYAQVVPRDSDERARLYFSEFSDFKCCQKQAFYSEYAQKVFTKTKITPKK